MPGTATPPSRSERRRRVTSPPAEPRLSQRPLFDDEGSLDAQFKLYLEKHGDVYAAFRRYAEQLLAAGVQHYGAKAIIEVVRFHRTLHSTDEEPFRVDNRFTSRLARRLADDDPRFNEFFEMRRLRSA